MTKSQGFEGKIKNHWQDFEVREVGLDSTVAGIDIDEGPKYVISSVFALQTVGGPVPKEPLAGPSNNAKVAKGVKIEADCLMPNLASTKNVFTPEKIEEKPESYLRQILSVSIMDELHALRLEEGSERSVNLGQFDDKQTRMKVHQCVRFVYPYLRTSSTTNNQGGTEVEAYVDINFFAFLNCGGTDEEHLRDLFRYIHCQFIIGDKETFVLEASSDKEKRTAVHRMISGYFGSFLESKTFQGEHSNTSNQQAAPNTSTINVRFRRKRQYENTDQGDLAARDVYGFTLCKRNVENLDALVKLSRELKVKPSHFSYAGVKDKKALTFQNMTVEGVQLADLMRLSTTSKGRDVEVGNIRKMPELLHLGDLLGNVFKIVIRDLKIDTTKENATCESVLDAAISDITCDGFVNYFGPQRFGLEGNAINAADIGLAMLKGEMQKAVELMLSPSGQGDAVDRVKMRFQETKDICAALKDMPSWKTRECSILKALKQHGWSEEGCTKALFTLPYSIRLMYVHSYCSLVWNKIATIRMKQFGREIREGDLVMLDHQEEVYIVTQDDVVQARYTLTNLVLPLPGFRVAYPAELASVYESILSEDGISRSSFRLKKLSLNVPGAQRRVVVLPCNVAWNWYTEGDANMKDAVAGSTVKLNGIEQEAGRSLQSQTDAVASQQKRKDIVLSFSLKPSSYATIGLRELMKS